MKPARFEDGRLIDFDGKELRPTDDEVIIVLTKDEAGTATRGLSAGIREQRESQDRFIAADKPELAEAMLNESSRLSTLASQFEKLPRTMHLLPEDSEN